MKKLIIYFLLISSVTFAASGVYPNPTKSSWTDTYNWAQPRIASGTALPAVASAATGDLFILASTTYPVSLYRLTAGAWGLVSNTLFPEGILVTGPATFSGWVAIATDCWDDLQVQVTGVNLAGGGANPPAVDVVEDIGALTFDGETGTTVDMAAIVQLPHSFAPSTIYPHIHVRNLTAGNGTATFELWYKSADAGESFASAYTVATLTYAVPASTATHQIYDLAAIDASSLGDSAVICFFLRRIVSDTSTTDINLLSFDVHYKRNRLGSAEQNGHR